jgi:hypothetical protein
MIYQVPGRILGNRRNCFRRDSGGENFAAGWLRRGRVNQMPLEARAKITLCCLSEMNIYRRRAKPLVNQSFV